MNLIQENVCTLKAYHVENIDCEIKLHANENPFPPSKDLLDLLSASVQSIQLNRYPDPDSHNLKCSISKRLNVTTNRLVIDNGSDEIILLLLTVLPPILILLFVIKSDKFPEPTITLIITFILGALGIILAGFLNSMFEFQLKQTIY